MYSMKKIVLIILIIIVNLCLYKNSAYAGSRLDYITLTSDSDSIIAVNKNINKIYIGSTANQTITIVDLIDKKIASTIVLTEPISSSGKVLYSTNNVIIPTGKNLQIINGNNDSIEKTISVSDIITSFDIDQSAKKIWLTSTDKNISFSVIEDLASSVVKNIVINDEAGNIIKPYKIYFYPKTNQLLLIVENKIYLVDSSQNTVTDTIQTKYAIENEPLFYYYGALPGISNFNEKTGVLYTHTLGKLFVTNINDKSELDGIDITNTSIKGDFKGTGNILVNSNRDEIYITNTFENKLIILNGKTNKITDLSLVDNPMFISKDPRYNKIYILSFLTPNIVLGRIFYVQVIDRDHENKDYVKKFTYIPSFNESVKRLEDSLTSLIANKNPLKIKNIRNLIRHQNFYTKKLKQALVSTPNACKKEIINLLSFNFFKDPLIEIIKAHCNSDLTAKDKDILVDADCRSLFRIGTEFLITKTGIQIDLDQDRTPDVCLGGDKTKILLEPACKNLNENSALCGSTYIELVQDIIRSNWQPKKNVTSYKVFVNFQITKDGQVENLKIVTSSGSNDNDEAALEAIKDSAPFPVVPELLLLNGDSKFTKIDIEFTFDYNVISQAASNESSLTRINF